MTYEVCRYIFIGGTILSIIMLIVSIILFFVLKIPNVIGDLTGANARKAIENIRNQNESSGEKLYKSSEVNRNRGKLTDKISPSGNLIHHSTGRLYGAMKTEKISSQQSSGKSVGDETTVLDGGNETTVLNVGNETTVLNNGNETTVLNSQMFSAEMGHTGRLDVEHENYIASLSQEIDESSCFEITYEITLIHTQEVIG